MSSVDVYLRRSELNESLQKIGSLTWENGLIYRDENVSPAGYLSTIVKFTTLTAASPLIGATRLVRSAAFLLLEGNLNRAGREFLGGLAQPFVAATCLAGSLLASAASLISSQEVFFYIGMRRTYAYFEAWINDIELKGPLLFGYKHRVSSPTDLNSRIWTTAPCMQPLLERGFSRRGGLLDPDRMQKIFPFIPVDGVELENGALVIQSHYIDRDLHYTTCDGACEHSSRERTCCCCFRIEAIYDRFLCTEVGQGSCTSMINPGNSCGIVTCRTCCVGCCCCYVQENEQITLVNAGCFGPHGPSCVMGMG